MSKSTRQIVFCAALLALSVLASNIRIFTLPFGGNVTLFSMFFISLAGSIYGTASGIILGMAFGLFVFLEEPVFLSVPQFLLDYLFAFGALGVGSLRKNTGNALIRGYLTGISLRALFAALAGYVFWMDYMPEGFPASLSLLYPLIYNCSYIAAEGILTVLVLRIPAVRNAIARMKALALGEGL